jgi:hypothetical protein
MVKEDMPINLGVAEEYIQYFQAAFIFEVPVRI